MMMYQELRELMVNVFVLEKPNSQLLVKVLDSVLKILQLLFVMLKKIDQFMIIILEFQVLFQLMELHTIAKTQEFIT